MERKSSWIMVYSGKHFYLLDPRADEVDRIDIAHALSNICRFTGHTNYFYSVGTHSILCAEQARKDNMSAKIQLYCLLHDATEAYVGDVSRPLKKELGKIYTDMEDAIHKCVWEHFELPQPTEEEWRTVKHYDDFMLGNEAPQLMLNPDEFQDIEIVYDGVQIPRFGNVHVENRFLEILEFLLKEYKEETK
jgi:5'-deoxynucleotidase YfbR-like HD superfamily hydrolase